MEGQTGRNLCDGTGLGIMSPPALTKERAFLSANVVFQTVGGMTRLFAESDPQDQPTIVADYKGILTAYLTVILRG